MNNAKARTILRDYVSPRDIEMVAFVTCRPGSVELNREDLLIEIENSMSFCGSTLTENDLESLLAVHYHLMYCDLDSE